MLQSIGFVFERASRKTGVGTYCYRTSRTLQVLLSIIHTVAREPRVSLDTLVENSRPSTVASPEVNRQLNPSLRARQSSQSQYRVPRNSITTSQERTRRATISTGPDNFPSDIYTQQRNEPFGEIGAGNDTISQVHSTWQTTNRDEAHSLPVDTLLPDIDLNMDEILSMNDYGSSAFTWTLED